MRSTWNVFIVTVTLSLITLLTTFFGLYLGWLLSRELDPVLNALISSFFGIVGFSAGVSILWEIVTMAARKRRPT